MIHSCDDMTKVRSCNDMTVIGKERWDYDKLGNDMTTKCLQYDMIMIRHVNDGYIYVVIWYEICYGTRYVIIDMFMIWYIMMHDTLRYVS